MHSFCLYDTTLYADKQVPGPVNDIAKRLRKYYNTSCMFFAYIDPGTGFTLFSFGGWLIAALLAFLGFFSPFFRKFLFFLKKPKVALTILCLAACLGIIAIGAYMTRKTSAFDKKLVVLGLDGLSPEIAEPMLDAGKLPNLAALRARGSYRRVSTTNPSQSPVAWAAVATGKNPGKNGIFDFITRDPKDYKLSLSLSNVERGKPRKVLKDTPFWLCTSKAGIPSVLLNFPLTFPPDRIGGRMLSGMGVPDILGTEGTFTFYTTEPIPKDRDIGGNVFQVRKSKAMVLSLIGPKVATPFGKADNVKVPFKVTLRDGGTIDIEYQRRRLELRSKKWSGWQEVAFKIGPFKTMRGIFKFYLVEAEPGFRLYISPINIDPRKPFFPISFPKGYSAELAKKTGLYRTQGMPMDTWPVNEGRLTEDVLLEQVEDVFREKKAIFDLELNRFTRGVLFAYFDMADIVQHMFWRYRDSSHPLYEKDAPADCKRQIEIWYEKLDSVVGDVLKRLGPDDTLIVLSDHGFNTFRRAVHVNAWLRKNGYLELKDPYAVSGAELLSDIDWSKTKAYAIGFGAIYINQKGRERDGIVRPGNETEALKNEIAAKLKEWIDEKYGAPVVNSAYMREAIFRGKYASDTPDIYIGFNAGYRASWQTALGAVPENTLEDNLKKWSGDHLFDPRLVPGILFSNKKITKENPSLYDIAPTILKAAGYSGEKLKKCDLDGEPLF